MHFSERVNKALSWGSYELHQHPMLRFSLVMTILVAYFLLVSVRLGLGEGLLITALTWSFFVLCTPIADAGVLLDLPLRVIANIRMVYSELLVWSVAIVMNVVVFVTAPHVYEETLLLSLLSHIIAQPFPYWGIIVLSAIGTFLSVIFGDELVDIALEHKDEREHHTNHHIKHKLLVLVFLIILIVLLYDFLFVQEFGVSIPF